VPLAVLLGHSLLYWLGKRKERRAGNPLVGLLDEYGHRIK
jgi:hypothetical protein